MCSKRSGYVGPLISALRVLSMFALQTLRSVIYESDCSSLQNETLVGVIDDQGRYTSIGSRALISDDFKGFAGRNFRVACVNVSSIYSSMLFFTESSLKEKKTHG